MISRLEFDSAIGNASGVAASRTMNVLELPSTISSPPPHMARSWATRTKSERLSWTAPEALHRSHVPQPELPALTAGLIDQVRRERVMRLPDSRWSKREGGTVLSGGVSGSRVNVRAAGQWMVSTRTVGTQLY